MYTCSNFFISVSLYLSIRLYIFQTILFSLYSTKQVSFLHFLWSATNFVFCTKFSCKNQNLLFRLQNIITSLMKRNPVKFTIKYAQNVLTWLHVANYEFRQIIIHLISISIVFQLLTFIFSLVSNSLTISQLIV